MENSLVESGFDLMWKNGRYYYYGNLTVYRCPNFKSVVSLPDNLTVVGNLDLYESRITKLPKGLVVTECLRLDKSLIKELSNDLYVGHDLQMNFTEITSIPATIKVYGYIYLGKKISKLPDNLTIETDLDLRYTTVSVLPKGLHVKRDLNITGLKIKQLPDDIVVDRTYILTSSSITSLPDDMQVNGSLLINNTKITSLPKNLRIKDTLNLERTGIFSLPNDLVVGEDLLIKSTLISSLPENLVVGRDLICDDLLITKIPENLVVGRNLSLQGTSLTSLPDNLTVGGDLDVSYTSIKKFPKNLIVRGYMLSTPNRKMSLEFRNINNRPQILVWNNEKYMLSDGVLVEVVSHRGYVYRVRKLYSDIVSYIITDGYNNWAHGKNFKLAKASLISKIQNRDVSQYKYLFPNSRLFFHDAIMCYKVITGASSFGIHDFIVHRLKYHRAKYSICEIADITEGEYGNLEFKQFFNLI